jgi:N-acetylneuraminic acid mutarotase
MSVENGSWRTLPSLSQARSHSPVLPYKNKLYVFGGGGPEFKSMASSVVLDLETETWSDCCDMPTKRSGTAGFLIQDKICIIGGGFKKPDGNFQFLPTTEIYDPETDSWISGPDMNQPHDYPAAAQLGDTAYIMGGHHPDACLGGPKTDPGFTFSERWTPGQDKWEQIADMPTPRFAAAAFSHGGKIFTSGGVAFTPEGFNNFDFFENYDPQSNSWSEDSKVKLPWVAAGHGQCIVGDKIFFFGGYSSDNIHSRAAVGDINTGEWTRLPDMPLPRAAMGVAVIGKTIYLVGGWADDGRTPIDSVVAYSWD